MATSISQLTPLLPSTPYLLAYALPLLLISLLLTFAGTFLTLDRSRSFPPADGGPSYTTLTPGRFPTLDKKKPKFVWVLEGGAGGLAAGYLFGVHVATALALLIPATTSSASLSPKSFLAVWILSCVVTTPVAARYRYAAFGFLGISGGTLTGLAICIITHPTLFSRVVLVALFLPLFTILVLLVAILPIPRLTNSVFHPLLRVCTASTGAFGVMVSIALLLKPQEEGWANAWERLWLSASPTTAQGVVAWGTVQEQGLSTGYVVFFVAGIATDWALRRWIGECPDQKWDDYLARYAASLPNRADRAGTFQPLTSVWERLFSSTSGAPFGSLKEKRDIIFPDEADMKSALRPHHLPLPLSLPLPVNMQNVPPAALGRAESQDILRKDKDRHELSSVPSTAAERLKKKKKKKRGTRYGGWRIMNANSNESDGNGSGSAAEGRKGRKPVRFGAVSDSSEDEDETTPASDAATRPQMGHAYTSSSSPTLVDAHSSVKAKAKPDLRASAKPFSSDYALDTTHDPRLDALATLDYDQEIAHLKARFGGAGDSDYSDPDSDVEDKKRGLLQERERDRTSAAGEQQAKEQREWSPAFLQRHQSQSQSQKQSQGASGGSVASAPAPGPVPVPATPSLIKALDRLALAQRTAFGGGVAAGAGAGAGPAPLPLGGLRMDEADVEDVDGDEGHSAMDMTRAAKDVKAARAPRWEEFWREVRVKAQA